MSIDTVIWLLALAVLAAGVYALVEVVALVRWQRKNALRHHAEITLLKSLHANEVARLREVVTEQERRLADGRDHRDH